MDLTTLLRKNSSQFYCSNRNLLRWLKIAIPDADFVTKRVLNLTVAAMSMCGLLNSLTPLLAKEMELERYTNSKEGFTLLKVKPSSWTKVDRAGATVLLQEANKEETILGLWKTRFALKVLKSLEILNLWLISLYKQKNESTQEAEVVKFAERSGEGGLPIYEFEYVVDSSRGGMKRIFSAAFVASKKLYLLNIVHSDKPESPLDSHKKNDIRASASFF